MLKRFTPVFILTAACWLVFAINNVALNGRLSQYGIIPRQLSGLPGILWAPFLHASLAHLVTNTFPLSILGAVLCARSRKEFIEVAVSGTLMGGFATWLFARNADHIGASGLIFCFFGYLTSMAWFKRNAGTFILSAICVLGYGGMLRGIFPTSAHISWEGHLFGLLSGVLLAFIDAKVSADRSATSSS